MEKKFYELQELTQEERAKDIKPDTTIWDVIQEHEGEDESPASIMVTTNKDEAFKALKDYDGDCCRIGNYYSMRYARLTVYTIDMDDLDEDDAKTLSFKGTKTTGLEEIDQAIANVFNGEFDEYFNDDFTGRKVMK